MSKARILWFALLSAVAAWAVAADPAAEALEGAWIVQVGAQSRDRFLLVEGAKRDQNLVVPSSAKYGWIDGKGGVVREWKAEIAGDSIHLSFHTPADSLVKVTFKVEDTTVAGEIRVKSGKLYPVRMTRIEPDEMAALRATSAAAKKQSAAPMKLAKDARIYLVYVSAPDCPSCNWFRSNNLGNNRKKLRELLPELDAISFVDAVHGSYKTKLLQGAFPEELKWLATADANGKFPLKKRGVPFFAAVVDNRIVAQGHGETGLETLVVPELKRMVAARSAAN